MLKNQKRCLSLLQQQLAYKCKISAHLEPWRLCYSPAESPCNHSAQLNADAVRAAVKE